MKAVVLESPELIKVKEVIKPVRKNNEALIRVKAVGICGSDIGAFRGTNPLVTYPRVIGHEIAGEIIEIENNKKGLKRGDRVIIEPYLYCGKCYPCSLGRTNCCEEMNVIGVHVDGGMSELLTHCADMLWPVPDNIGWKIIPLIEPLTIALHTIHRAKLKAGEYIAINGAGAIGLLIALTAISYNAIPIMVDPVENRLEFARSLGVINTVSPLDQDFLYRINKITNGRMAEVVVEASGANEAIKNTLNMVSNAGRISLTGWPKKETPIPTNIITKKELDVVGARNSSGEFEEAIKMVSTEKIDVKAVLSKVISLDEVPQIVKEQSDYPERYLKVVVRL